uniref:Putative sodium-dependent multivitamin transporter n=1 Tax=Aceria tosichella TaxID=561515 RepID=A0A6G1SGX8_9ACAR
MTLGTVDYVLLVGSVVASALIGIYFTNKNKSMEAYMMGDRSMSVFPVGVSLMTSCLSGLTLLGASAEFFYQGPTYSFVFIPMLLSGPITAFTMLPVFYRMNTLSLYKYLHKRYGLTIKYIVTVVFMLQMIFYNAVVLYLPSMALGGTLGVPRFYSILLLGITCIIYSGIGGVKAVIWSDLFQAVLMFAALFVVGLLGTLDAGGFQEVLHQAKEGGRLDLTGFFNLDLTTRHTLLGIVIGSTIKHVYLVGVNQVQIQRALSLATLRQGQLAFCFCSLCGALVILMASYLGAVIAAAYRSCDPFISGDIARRDAILVHYVAHRLAVIPGLRGIFVAGIFSATLSTLSSFANSMAALALEDFVRPIMRTMKIKRLSDTDTTWLAKLLATLFGIACVLTAYLIEKANSRLLQATTTMFGAIGVPFLASFALGIFTRFVNTTGILAGFAVTLSLGSYITIYQTFFRRPLEPLMPVYYSEQCERVFNMTLTSDELTYEPSFLPLYKSFTSFSVDQISYMMLPTVQFVLMILVTSLVSILTGGLNQEVDDEYLISFMQRGSGKKLGSSDSVSSGGIITKTMRPTPETNDAEYNERFPARNYSKNLHQASLRRDVAPNKTGTG